MSSYRRLSQCNLGIVIISAESPAKVPKATFSLRNGTVGIWAYGKPCTAPSFQPMSSPVILSVRLGHSREQRSKSGYFPNYRKIEGRRVWSTLGMGSEPRVRFPSKASDEFLLSSILLEYGFLGAEICIIRFDT